MVFDIAINNALILSSHNGYRPFKASVGIRDGLIVALSPSGVVLEGRTIVEACGKLLMPGLVNGHCHGDLTILKGLGDGLTLKQQNEQFSPYGWFRKYINETERYLSRQMTYCEALLSGTTFMTESMFWSLGLAAIDAMKETGICGMLAENARHDFSKPDELIDNNYLETFALGCTARGILPALVGVAEEDFDGERLARIAEKSKGLGIWHTFHLAETTWRLAMIRERFGMTPVAYLEQCGVLHEKVLASHAVYLSDEDINLLSERGVSVVNTPVAEMKLADGVALIPRLLKAGVTVGLGTDGAMWNNSADLFREMKVMLLLHSLTSQPGKVTERDVLDMATINGARMFGLERQMGTVEEGKFADVILLDMQKPHLCPVRIENHTNVASLVVNSAVGADVTDVFVRGRRVVENGRLTTLDVKKLCVRANAISERLSKSIVEMNYQ